MEWQQRRKEDKGGREGEKMQEGKGLKEGGGVDGKRGDWEVFLKEQINTDQLATVGFFVSNSSVTAS